VLEKYLFKKLTFHNLMGVKPVREIKRTRKVYGNKTYLIVNIDTSLEAANKNATASVANLSSCKQNIISDWHKAC
jgi:hypothetical protein